MNLTVGRGSAEPGCRELQGKGRDKLSPSFEKLFRVVPPKGEVLRVKRMLEAKRS